MSKHLTETAMTMVLLWFAAPAAQADMIYNVSLDTSVLANNSGQGPFAVDFQLNDGSTGDGVANNTATITNFTLTGGGSLGTLNPLGFPPGSDVSGGLSSTLTITDSTGPLGIGINDFNQQFTPGTQLSFTLDLTTNVSPSEGNGPGVPDQFSFTVYSNIDSINGPSTASLLTIAITGPNPVPTTTPGSLGDGTFVPAPSAVPEPASLILFAVALATAAAGWSWQRRRGVTSIDPATPAL